MSLFSGVGRVADQIIKEYEFSEIHQLRGKDPLLDGFSISQESHRQGEDTGFIFPFRSDHHVIIFLLKGKVKVQWNLTSVVLEKHDLIAISGRVVTQSIEMLEDSLAMIITFTREFALQNVQKSRALESFKLLSAPTTPKISLSPQDSNAFHALTSYLHLKAQNEQEAFLSEKIVHAFNLLFYELSTLYDTYHPVLPIDLSRKEELAASFIKLLGQHFRIHRSVDFYAQALHVTAGHLTKMLKRVSGKSARQLIDSAVVLEAKMLLANRSLTIAQIATALNFSDQSFFGKFFKKEAGLSPSAYRQTLAQG